MDGISSMELQTRSHAEVCDLLLPRLWRTPAKLEEEEEKKKREEEEKKAADESFQSASADREEVSTLKNKLIACQEENSGP